MSARSEILFKEFMEIDKSDPGPKSLEAYNQYEKQCHIDGGIWDLDACKQLYIEWLETLNEPNQIGN